jgi:hypothetical protein
MRRHYPSAQSRLPAHHCTLGSQGHPLDRYQRGRRRHHASPARHAAHRKDCAVAATRRSVIELGGCDSETKEIARLIMMHIFKKVCYLKLVQKGGSELLALGKDIKTGSNIEIKCPLQSLLFLRGRLHAAFWLASFMYDKPFDAEACVIIWCTTNRLTQRHASLFGVRQTVCRT